MESSLKQIDRSTVDAVLRFRADRDWEQFHTPRTLASSLVIETAELLEVFQWTTDRDLKQTVEAKRTEIEDEIADIAIYLTLLVHDLDIDLDSIVNRKLAANAARYPVEAARGRSTKYTDL